VSTLQEQARALGDPTRHAIFQYVAEAAAPVGVAELTAHFELNHNAIRQHLAKLVGAQLLTESIVATGGLGRPPLRFEVSPRADGRWGTTTPYQRLSLLLSEAIRTGDSCEEVGRRAGHRLRVAPSDDPVKDVADALDRQGFESETRTRRGGADIVLRACPFAAAALEDPDTVCGLHLGIAHGLAEGTGVEVDELVVKDPRRAGCRVRLRADRTPAGDTRSTR
jgi:predicted ArsR family transcriptional regulator